MRIEFSGTPLESVLKLNETRPIDFIYLDKEEFGLWLEEAKYKHMDITIACSWFTIAEYGIVFYLE